jgi:acyl-CoA reductase-like NAD-dependent aldehyde dehydrogenase
MATITGASPAIRNYSLFIDGVWTESRSGKFVDNRNPARIAEVLGHVPLALESEVDAAVDAAERAFKTWRRTPAPRRGKIVAAAASILARRKEEVARALTLEEGKILREARGEVERSINILDFIAGESRRFGGETLPSELENNFCYTVRQPLGVVAVITPWNFPVAIPCWKIAPALVAGNTVVFKPATLTPLTASLVVEVFAEAGLPPGCLNMVLGSGGQVGDRLVRHAAVRAVSFTGSNEIGGRLYAQGAERMIKVQCEMGGKNPVVVLEDADLELAAAATASGAFGSTGQRCTATSRAVVVDSIADRFAEAVVQRARAYKIGNGLDESVDMGPSVDEGQMRTVLHYLDEGRREGARLLCGGERLRGGEYDGGWFVAPTVFDHVGRGMSVAQEEIFGPVLSIQRVRDFDEALEAANDVRFGLASSIFTRDCNLMFRFVEEIETGIAHVNSGTVGGEAQLPFGGIKATGVGPREQGTAALDFYSEVKTVYVDYTGQKRQGNLY